MEYLQHFKPTNRVMPSNPSVVMRGNFINSVFDRNVEGLTFTIGENCKTAINDFIMLKEASDGTKLKEMDTDPKTKVRYQKVGHFSDLFDYIVCSAFGAEFQSYLKGGKPMTFNLGRNKPSKHGY